MGFPFDPLKIHLERLGLAVRQSSPKEIAELVTDASSALEFLGINPRASELQKEFEKRYRTAFWRHLKDLPFRATAGESWLQRELLSL
jgi:hypothetical protein